MKCFPYPLDLLEGDWQIRFIHCQLSHLIKAQCLILVRELTKVLFNLSNLCSKPLLTLI